MWTHNEKSSYGYADSRPGQSASDLVQATTDGFGHQKGTRLHCNGALRAVGRMVGARETHAGMG